jgi:glycerol kinase
VPEFVGALDQGTTSTRFMVFDHDAGEVARCQVEHRQLTPRPGWVEHDPLDILERSKQAVAGALAEAGLRLVDLAAVGITNQRETLVLWDRSNGQPFSNAIVWQDTRSAGVMDALRRAGRAGLLQEKTGLPLSTYFSAGKLRWALDNLPELRAAAAAGRACAGTMDSWLIWNLTGRRHLTDVTNASRTMLMDLRRLQWDPSLLEAFDVPGELLPEIRPSFGGDVFGEADFGLGAAGAAAVAAVLGDQHAAMVGQACFEVGQAKNTYGTGNFLLVNTGPAVVESKSGMLSTLCFQQGGGPALFALEGSVAVTGAAVQWLRDQLGIIGSASEVEELAAQVPDAGGVYFVPAFSGLFAPYWRPDARGTIVGLTRAANKAHLARAVLEAICFQTRDVVLAMEADLGHQFDELRVDGGVTANDLCMQLQADILGLPVVRPAVQETTALGAAFAAGCTVGFWSGLAELRELSHEGRRFEPAWSEDRREAAYAGWKKALERSLGWVGPDANVHRCNKFAR